MVGSIPISIIAAIAPTNRVIGHQGRLPWHLPEDLQRFKALTLGHPIIMGRKTWELCLNKRILPHRHNIVVSRSFTSEDRNEALDRPPELLTASNVQSADGSHTSLQMVRSIPDALALANQLSQASPQPYHRIFVMGGASIYAQTIALAHCLELTIVHGSFEGDTFFPPYEHLIAEFDCVASLYQAHTTPPSTYITYQRCSTLC